MWIKICGLTTRAAVEAAVDAKVDAMGFVFAPSKRQVTVEQAEAITQKVPPQILRVAVLQHPEQSLVDLVLSRFKPDVLQTDFEDLAGLRIDSVQKILPVVRSSKKNPAPLPPWLLFEGPTSGQGETADWMRAAELAVQTRVILAGGLNSENVGDAIARVRPFGVDVSSGVESSPGVKDLQKIVEFVKAVRGG